MVKGHWVSPLLFFFFLFYDYLFILKKGGGEPLIHSDREKCSKGGQEGEGVECEK